MLRSVPDAKRINEFIEVRIPKTSVLFMKYGEKVSKRYSTSSTDITNVQTGRGGSYISQMISAQNALKRDLEALE